MSERLGTRVVVGALFTAMTMAAACSSTSPPATGTDASASADGQPTGVGVNLPDTGSDTGGDDGTAAVADAAGAGVCKDVAQTCSGRSDCCSGFCNPHIIDGQPCAFDAECASGNCAPDPTDAYNPKKCTPVDGGTPTTAPGPGAICTCGTHAIACTGDQQCCPGYVCTSTSGAGYRCLADGSNCNYWCTPGAATPDCCTGFCVVFSGSGNGTIGRCQDAVACVPPGGSASSRNQCCNYGPLANGKCTGSCRSTGSCTQPSDCCSGRCNGTCG